MFVLIIVIQGSDQCLNKLYTNSEEKIDQTWMEWKVPWISLVLLVFYDFAYYVSTLKDKSDALSALGLFYFVLSQHCPRSGEGVGALKHD